MQEHERCSCRSGNAPPVVRALAHNTNSAPAPSVVGHAPATCHMGTAPGAQYLGRYTPPCPPCAAPLAGPGQGHVQDCRLWQRVLDIQAVHQRCADAAVQVSWGQGVRGRGRRPSRHVGKQLRHNSRNSGRRFLALIQGGFEVDLVHHVFLYAGRACMEFHSAACARAHSHATYASAKSLPALACNSPSTHTHTHTHTHCQSSAMHPALVQTHTHTCA